ncbi:cyclic nucleotide-binding domain-containing protein [Bdellovibrio bacteriovorus]|uniref:cyclic nucleotide-binding domain-containing protein n=1 Tax=Bdellovibrio bacteriovorus TaxID=959 RepID=UPI0021D25719|nr:cyclic nucleotide-binding domain-containing protein [Bdellovibrio bacteriovorus]UXR63456.1 cyclic nucleotide-binding domain-containing protein [Bdellovibrio bacteriovorus]
MAEAKKVAKDTYLFRDGDAPDAMYIVKTGGFAITKSKGNTEVVIAEIQPGAMVGEMALFDKKPRSANVKATKDSEVIALPYDSLNKQMDQLPVWVRAIMKTLNEKLRDANQKIRLLENTNPDEERFPPHIVNKYISILNLVGNKYGKPEDGGTLSFSSVLIRNYTIQIFQEATNKMQSVVNALTDLGYLAQEDRGDGTQKISNLKPQELFGFVDWYNEWLFKQDKDRLPALSEQEVAILNGILLFARRVEPNHKGLYKVDLTDVQNESMKELGQLIRADDVNSLIEKKYLTEKIMDEKGVYIMVELPYVEPLARNWTIVNNLKRKLR